MFLSADVNYVNNYDVVKKYGRCLSLWFYAFSFYTIVSLFNISLRRNFHPIHVTFLVFVILVLNRRHLGVRVHIREKTGYPPSAKQHSYIHITSTSIFSSWYKLNILSMDAKHQSIIIDYRDKKHSQIG